MTKHLSQMQTLQEQVLFYYSYHLLYLHGFGFDCIGDWAIIECELVLLYLEIFFKMTSFLDHWSVEFVSSHLRSACFCSLKTRASNMVGQNESIFVQVETGGVGFIHQSFFFILFLINTTPYLFQYDLKRIFLPLSKYLNETIGALEGLYSLCIKKTLLSISLTF